jgi:hypothetical protein
MENTCSHSEGGLAESSSYQHWTVRLPPSQILSYITCDQHIQEILSVEQRVFIYSTFAKCVPWKKNHQNLVKSIQHQQCCSKEQYSERCGNSWTRGLMLHKLKVWKCYVRTDDKLEKLVLEWKQVSQNHCASCLFKPGHQLSQLAGELNFLLHPCNFRAFLWTWKL